MNVKCRWIIVGIALVLFSQSLVERLPLLWNADMGARNLVSHTTEAPACPCVRCAGETDSCCCKTATTPAEATALTAACDTSKHPVPATRVVLRSLPPLSLTLLIPLPAVGLLSKAEEVLASRFPEPLRLPPRSL